MAVAVDEAKTVLRRKTREPIDKETSERLLDLVRMPLDLSAAPHG
jgi:hypothetical protein